MNQLAALYPSFNQTTRIILATFKWIGLIPFDVECISLKLQLRSVQQIQFSYKWILMTVAFFSAKVVIVAIFHQQVFFTYYAVGLINDMLKYIGGMVAIYITLVEVFAQRKDHVHMYERLTSTDLNKLVFKLRQGKEHRKCLKRFNFKFFALLATILIIELRIFLKIITYSKQWRNVWVTNFPMLSFLRLRVLYYIFTVDILQAQLTSVRVQILKVCETMKLVKMWHPNSKQYRQTVDKVCNSLIYLKQCYTDIWFCHFHHNQTTGWSICFIMVSYFVQFSSDLYWLYLTVNEKATDGYGEIILCLCPAPLLICAILYSTERCMEVSRQVGTLLHEIPKHSEKNLYHIIYRFSSHISHQPIRFVAHSLFDVNYKLIKMLLTAVVTYMFIFIPFGWDAPKVKDFITTTPESHFPK
uniref:gustatory receptor 17 n=1 Tax=Aedes aegypti TaxID=7159 RepID=UPI000BAB00D7|nr:gustatory receptor 17 [Aedes aegypti]